MFLRIAHDANVRKNMIKNTLTQKNTDSTLDIAADCLVVNRNSLDFNTSQ